MHGVEDLFVIVLKDSRQKDDDMIALDRAWRHVNRYGRWTI